VTAINPALPVVALCPPARRCRVDSPPPEPPRVPALGVSLDGHSKAASVLGVGLGVGVGAGEGVDEARGVGDEPPPPLHAASSVPVNKSEHAVRKQAK
jgi:hypothetical protein